MTKKSQATQLIIEINNWLSELDRLNM